MIVPKAISIGHKIRSLRPCMLYGRSLVGKGAPRRKNPEAPLSSETRPLCADLDAAASSGDWYINGWYSASIPAAAITRAASCREFTPSARIDAFMRASTVCGDTPMIRPISLEFRCAKTCRKVSTCTAFSVSMPWPCGLPTSLK